MATALKPSAFTNRSARRAWSLIALAPACGALGAILSASPAAAQMPPVPGTRIALYDVSVSGTEQYQRDDTYHGQGCDEHLGSESHHQTLTFHSAKPARFTLVRVPHGGTTFGYPIIHKARRLTLTGSATITGTIDRQDQPCEGGVRAWVPYTPKLTDCGTKPLPPMEGALSLFAGALHFTAAPSGGTLTRERDPFAGCELGQVKGAGGEEVGIAPVHFLISDESVGPHLSIPHLFASRHLVQHLRIRDVEPFGSASSPVDETVTRVDDVTVTIRRVGRVKTY